MIIIFYSFESDSHLHNLLVSHWSLRESKYPYVLRTLLSIIIIIISEYIIVSQYSASLWTQIKGDKRKLKRYFFLYIFKLSVE